MVLLLLSLLLAQDTNPQERLTRWQQDIQFFAAEFSRSQVDFSRLYRRDAFDAELKRLQEELPALSDAEVTLRLMKLVASANVAHTMVGFPTAFGFFRRLPLTLYWYSDGLGVATASQEYASSIGAKVLKVGTRTPDELLLALSPYVPHEDDVWLREQAPKYLITLAMVQHLGLAGPDGRVVFTLAKPGGSPFTLSVAVADPRLAQITLPEAMHLPSPFLHDQVLSPDAE